MHYPAKPPTSPNSSDFRNLADSAWNSGERGFDKEIAPPDYYFPDEITRPSVPDMRPPIAELPSRFKAAIHHLKLSRERRMKIKLAPSLEFDPIESIDAYAPDKLRLLEAFYREHVLVEGRKMRPMTTDELEEATPHDFLG